jgi:hypothetical protein
MKTIFDAPNNHALQRTRRGRRGCNRRLPCAGSLSLGRRRSAAPHRVTCARWDCLKGEEG